MNEDQEQKCYVCRFCKQSFSNGKKLGGHMRRHLGLISACRKMGSQENDDNDDHDHDDGDDQVIKKTEYARKQGMQENDQEVFNGGTGLDFDDGDDIMINKSQQETGVDQDYRANVYVLRENPKRSWRVSNSSKDNGNFCKKRCNSRKESSMKIQCVCDKCGKSFNSMKALYGHMRCHSNRRSRLLDESSLMSSSDEHDVFDNDDDDEVANPVRKKRSCTRYKSPKPNHHCSTSLCCSDDDVEQGAICLMMLSRGVRSLDEGNLLTSQQAEFEVSVDGSMECCKLKNKFIMGLKKDLIVEPGSSQSNTGRAGSMKCSKMKNKSKCKLGLKKDLIVESGSSQSNPDRAGSMKCCKMKNKNKCEVGLKKDLIFESELSQSDPGRSGSTQVKHKSLKKQCDQDFGDMDTTDSDISLELKRKSKDHNCPICFKEFGSGRALGCHKRVHNHIPDVHRLVNPDLHFLREVSTMVMWGSSLAKVGGS